MKTKTIYFKSTPMNKETQTCYIKCTCKNDLEYSNCNKNCERVIAEKLEDKETRDLMAPRYKVIADYPNQPFGIGAILNDRDGEYFHITTIEYFNEFGNLEKQANWVEESEVKKYPALFQPLPWYAERSEDELPEYVKHVDTGEVIKVTKIETGKHYKNLFSPDLKYGSTKYVEMYQPATLEEYQSQSFKERSYE